MTGTDWKKLLVYVGPHLPPWTPTGMVKVRAAPSDFKQQNQPGGRRAAEIPSLEERNTTCGRAPMRMSQELRLVDHTCMFGRKF
eukprot:2333933-Amphidinium_carterae.1